MATETAFATFIKDRNRWSLPEPPAWWQAQLRNFDHMLVVIPSRFAPHYLLCRRRQFSAGLGDVAMLDNKHPDTNMCVSLGVVPVSTLRWKKGKSVFQQEDLNRILDELRRRDTWQLSGGPTSETGEKGLDKLVDAVEENERAVARKERASLKEKFYHLGREAYRALAARTGRRNKRASDYHGVAAPTKTVDKRRVKQ
jgi:hypothetical protein